MNLVCNDCLGCAVLKLVEGIRAALVGGVRAEIYYGSSLVLGMRSFRKVCSRCSAAQLVFCLGAVKLVFLTQQLPSKIKGLTQVQAKLTTISIAIEPSNQSSFKSRFLVEPSQR